MRKLFISVSKYPTNFGSTLYRLLFEHYKIEANYVARQAPEEAVDLVTAIRSLNLAGCSVSMPLKARMLEHLDHVDDLASKLNSVNTIINNNSILSGHNTDLAGMIRLFSGSKFPKALIYGSGAMLPAVVHLLREYCQTQQISIFARNQDSANNVAKSLELNCCTLEEILASTDKYSIFINATPISLTAENQQIVKILEQTTACFDMPISHSDTWLIKAAKIKRVPSWNGRDMYIGHIQQQFKLYTGIDPDISIITEAIIKLQENH